MTAELAKMRVVEEHQHDSPDASYEFNQLKFEISLAGNGSFSNSDV
jgi:hypothetical protein